MKNKLNDEICLIPYCKNEIILVSVLPIFCAEHIQKFVKFLQNIEIEQEPEEKLETNLWQQTGFYKQIIFDFVEEEMDIYFPNKRTNK